MSEIIFVLKPVEKKREVKAHKRSKYDPILDQFIESGHELVEVTIKGRSAHYIAGQLNKRILRRKIDFIASTSGGVAYLEKKSPELT